MLNTDACQARVKPGCIILLSPVENQFGSHHTASAAQPGCSGTIHSSPSRSCLSHKSWVRAAPAHWELNPFASVLLLSLERWEQPPGNAVFWICYIIPRCWLMSLEGLNSSYDLMATGLIMGWDAQVSGSAQIEGNWDWYQYADEIALQKSYNNSFRSELLSCCSNKGDVSPYLLLPCLEERPKLVRHLTLTDFIAQL